MKYAFFVLALFLSACASAPAPPALVPNSIQVSANGRHASEAGIAATRDGRLFVVWSERDENRKYDIYVREYGVDLGAKSDRVRVNPNPGEARTWYGDAPSIVAAPDGALYVAWNRTYADGSPGNDLVLSISKDGGRTFGEPIKINDDTAPASHGMHGLTVDPRGRVLISWLDERYLKKAQAKRNAGGGPMLAMFFHHTPTPAAKEPGSEEPDAELYFAVVADGRPEGPNRKIGTQICPCCRVAVAAAPDGSVFVAFRKVWPGQFRHISLVRSLDGGATFSEPVQVSDDKWKLYACPVTGAAMRFNEKSELEIVWYSGGERGEKGLYRAASTDRGETFTEPSLVSTVPVKGSPVFAGDDLVFGSPEKSYLAASGKETFMADGSMPHAVDLGGKVITVLTKTSGDSSSIWLKN